MLTVLYKRPNYSRAQQTTRFFVNFFFFFTALFFLFFLLFNMPRSIGRDPFTAMTTTMQLVNKKRKENCAPLPSSVDTLCDTTTTTKKKKKSLVSAHVNSQPGKPKRKKHTLSRRRRNTNNNNNTLTDDIAATSLLLLRTSSTTTTTTTFSGGGFGGEDGCGLVFSSLPSLSGGKVGGDGGGREGGRGGVLGEDVKVDKTVVSPAKVVLSTPPQQPKTRTTKIRVVLPLLALSAKRRADLGKLYDARELLKRVKAVEKMF